jgi:ubiquinone/menaquinone biosynthesis C-methylase UbiE
MTETREHRPAPATKGRVLHSAIAYDVLAWLFLRGRERSFRERLVRLARIERGQSVLDVGCGTGSLAIAAKRRVGPAGRVYGIDASPEMIVRARRKAGKAGLAVTFGEAVVEALPFPDDRFDVVLSTLMLHHLPRPARERCGREIQRVLKPGGHVLAVDFGGASQGEKSFLDRFHRHGRVEVQDIVRLLGEAGLDVVESGPVGIRGLNFVLARTG